MADAANEEALAVHQELAAIQFHNGRACQRRPGLAWTQRFHGPCGTACSLERTRLVDRTDFQVVDPDLRQSLPAIEIENDLIDVGAREIHVALQLRAHDLLLLKGKVRRAA